MTSSTPTFRTEKRIFFAKKSLFKAINRLLRQNLGLIKKYKENPTGLNGAWKVFAVVLRKRRKGGRFNLHLFARSIRSRLFNVHIREAPGGERRCSNRFLSNSVSPPCPLKPMDALWKLFADVWWWSVSVMVYIHNAMEQGLPFSHLLELKKDSTAAGRECCGRTCSSRRSRSSPATWGERGSVQVQLNHYSRGQNHGPLEKFAFRPTYKSIFRLKGC